MLSYGIFFFFWCPVICNEILSYIVVEAESPPAWAQWAAGLEDG